MQRRHFTLAALGGAGPLLLLASTHAYALSGKAAGFGLVSQQDASIEQYVTGKTLDGLFLVIGEQEQQWRQNPAAAGSAIVKKVFGALR